jgi:hypothetical protein
MAPPAPDVLDPELNDMDPASLDELSPAEKETEPPVADDAPTRKNIEPALYAVKELPVEMSIAPVEAELLVPVDSAIEPLVLLSSDAAFAVSSRMDPVVDVALSPEKICTAPPTFDVSPGSSVLPAFIMIAPPSPLFPSPTLTVIDPARPELDTPVETKTSPDGNPLKEVSPPE